MAYTTIDDPSAYFQTVLYVGNATARSITFDGNTDMQPDLNWTKVRNSGTYHNLADSVRGATKQIYSNVSDAEASATDAITSFNSNGFSIGSNGDVNANTKNIVSWNWKAGTSFTNDASATGIGSIDSSGSVSTDAGFSITSYTGTGSAGTIKHGLSVAPSMVIIKNRDDGQSWRVGVTSIGFDKYLGLNGTGASTSSSGMFNNTAPTTSVFSVGSDGSTNASGEKCIAYCFADVKGYSKFGSYTGNGNNDGAFVYTGFKPAWFLIKSSSNAEQWEMVDNKRNTINPLNLLLYPDQGVAEFTGSTGDRLHCDFTANGVKLRGNASSANGNGLTYIYMCLAESPFVNSNKVPNNAR